MPHVPRTVTTLEIAAMAGFSYETARRWVRRWKKAKFLTPAAHGPNDPDRFPLDQVKATLRHYWLPDSPLPSEGATSSTTESVTR